MNFCCHVNRIFSYEYLKSRNCSLQIIKRRSCNLIFNWKISSNTLNNTYKQFPHRIINFLILIDLMKNKKSNTVNTVFKTIILINSNTIFENRHHEFTHFLNHLRFFCDCFNNAFHCTYARSCSPELRIIFIVGCFIYLSLTNFVVLINQLLHNLNSKRWYFVLKVMHKNS